MTELIESLLSPWGLRALTASVLVGIMCGVLGCFIVLRNMSLIGDALAHAVLPGVFFAFLLVGYSTLGFFIGSSIAGFLCALAISWIQQNVSSVVVVQSFVKKYREHGLLNFLVEEMTHVLHPQQMLI